MSEAGFHRKGEIDLPKLLDQFKERLGGEAGAIGVFIGVVRGESKKGGKVKRLHYESSSVAAEQLKEIAANAEKKIEGISEVAIHHLIDDLEPGEEILYVLVGGKHRNEVFEALPRIMNRVKSEVQIWKKEITENGEYWVHEIER